MTTTYDIAANQIFSIDKTRSRALTYNAKIQSLLATLHLFALQKASPTEQLATKSQYVRLASSGSLNDRGVFADVQCITLRTPPAPESAQLAPLGASTISQCS